MQPLSTSVAKNDSIGRNEIPRAAPKIARRAIIRSAESGVVRTTAAMIVHEVVAQPVTAATNYLAAAQRLLDRREPGDDEQAREAVDLAQECLLNAAEIMRTMTELAANKALSANSVDIHGVVRDVMKLYAGSWTLTPKVTLSTAACHVLGNPVQLGQVLTNLIRNAIEATAGQRNRRLSILSRSVANDRVEIRVEDNGPGIRPEMKKKLFTPLTSSKPSGRGVGLSICGAIVECHSGTIWAEPLSHGAAFCFTLPAVLARAHGRGGVRNPSAIESRYALDVNRLED